MKLLIMGAPGSGKGTQAEKISAKYNIPAVSTGAMLRAAIAEGTETGKLAEQYINDGKLVPDEVIIALVNERVAKDDCKNGYILDGFPRTLNQAHAMEQSGIEVDNVIVMNLPDEVIIKRLGGRRTCLACGATYHAEFNPSKDGENCDMCGAKLTIRDDDREETIKKRLETYYAQTEPVLEYYKNKGATLDIDSTGTVDEITVKLFEALERR